MSQVVQHGPEVHRISVDQIGTQLILHTHTHFLSFNVYYIKYLSLLDKSSGKEIVELNINAQRSVCSLQTGSSLLNSGRFMNKTHTHTVFVRMCFLHFS